MMKGNLCSKEGLVHSGVCVCSPGTGVTGPGRVRPKVKAEADRGRCFGNLT